MMIMWLGFGTLNSTVWDLVEVCFGNFSFRSAFSSTKARTCASLILRGANDFMCDEMERSLHDALCVVKRVLESKSVVPGGGAVEAALSIYLENYATSMVRSCPPLSVWCDHDLLYQSTVGSWRLTARPLLSEWVWDQFLWLCVVACMNTLPSVGRIHHSADSCVHSARIKPEVISDAREPFLDRPAVSSAVKWI